MKNSTIKKYLIILSYIWMVLSILGFISLAFGIVIKTVMQSDETYGFTNASVFFLILGFVLIVLGATFSLLFRFLSKKIDN